MTIFVQTEKPVYHQGQIGKLFPSCAPQQVRLFQTHTVSLQNCVERQLKLNCLFLWPVRFRTIPINTELRAFDDAVDVYMLDPRGFVVRRWLSRQVIRHLL